VQHIKTWFICLSASQILPEINIHTIAMKLSIFRNQGHFMNFSVEDIEMIRTLIFHSWLVPSVETTCGTMSDTSQDLLTAA